VLLVREVGVLMWIVMGHAVEAMQMISTRYWLGGMDRQLGVQ